MQRTPITPEAGAGQTTQLLDNLASLQRTTSAEIESHYDVQQVMDVYSSPDQRDLGGFATDVSRIIDQERKSLPRGTTIELRGQVDTMQTSFTRLGLGMVFAIVLVYLLMAVNFQSWLDPFIILTALPGAMAGMLWMLLPEPYNVECASAHGRNPQAIGVTGQDPTASIPSDHGFTNDERVAGKNAIDAALSAGFTRMRPVIMTALAMIIGMVPMALGLGDGGEQNAPLGRAVIGDLLLATPTTLFFVPIMYSLLRRRPPVNLDDEIAREAGEKV